MKILIILLIAAMSCTLLSLKEPGHKTVSFVSNDLKIIQKLVESYSRLGFEVESITPQSISVIRYNGSATTKGDILLIMKK